MIHWNPNPDILTLGPLRVRWYSLMFLAGFIAGYQIIKWMCRRENKDFGKLEPLLYYVVAGTTIGARLGHCLFYEPEYYLRHPIEILKIWQGGLASHGGTIGVILAIWLYSRRHPEYAFSWILDRMTLPAALTASFIRIGNLMNSEIVGRPADVPWAFVFEKVDALPRHPTQIYESATYFLLFVVLFEIYRRSKSLPTGLLFGLMSVWIYLSRIGWEFFKEAQVSFEKSMVLNMGQLLSIPFVVLGAYLIVRALHDTSAPSASSTQTARHTPPKTAPKVPAGAKRKKRR